MSQIHTYPHITRKQILSHQNTFLTFAFSSRQINIAFHFFYYLFFSSSLFHWQEIAINRIAVALVPPDCSTMTSLFHMLISFSVVVVLVDVVVVVFLVVVAVEVLHVVVVVAVFLVVTVVVFHLLPLISHLDSLHCLVSPHSWQFFFHFDPVLWFVLSLSCCIWSHTHCKVSWHNETNLLYYFKIWIQKSSNIFKALIACTNGMTKPMRLHFELIKGGQLLHKPITYHKLYD